MKLRYMFPATVALLVIASCGGGGIPGGNFEYGKKFVGNWGTDDGTFQGSDFYILLDEQGGIVSAKSYASQGAKCSIEGSVHKTGSRLDLTVVLTVDSGNAVCTNVSLSASGQLTYDSETKWWVGKGTGVFSDAPNSSRPLAFSLIRDDDW